MCGILGGLGRFPKKSFEKGLARLAHRGPDGSKIWQNSEGEIVLGHRRLAIIDLSDCAGQPMTAGNLTITFNGEIYNYKEIRSELQVKGYKFETKGDTEVILNAYQEWGVDCLSRFNGMWAFGIWDDLKKQLFLARDRFGVKPLFYSVTKNGFIFGSEMKALTPLMEEVCISDDFEWCLNNIYSYENSDKALIKGIKRFPAGHYALLSPGQDIAPRRYWNTIDHVERNLNESYDQQIERFQSLFFDACKLRMRSDVRIGTALSGGLDSSSVAAAMRFSALNSNIPVSQDWQNAFVATFTGTDLDEKEYAEEVVRHLHLKGHYYEIDAEKSYNELGTHLWYFEELFLTSPSPMIEIYQRIKANGVTVSLDGHGADELLAGYGNLIFQAVKDDPFNFSGIKKISHVYKDLRNIDKSDWENLVDGFDGRKNLLLFYLNKIFNVVKEKDEIVKRLGYFNAALYREFHNFILPTLLRNYDRYSMAAGVEVRMPFLDYRLVSYCFSLPWQSKIRNGYTKSILRDAMKPYLPPKISTRKTKVGFGTPFTNWLNGSWKRDILDLMESSNFKNSRVVDSKKVKGIVDGFYSSNRQSFEDGHRVWAALMPFFWEIYFFNKLS